MPFSSKRQSRKCYALRAKGKNKGWDCEEWSEHTNYKRLPEKKGQYDMNTYKLFGALLGHLSALEKQAQGQAFPPYPKIGDPAFPPYPQMGDEVYPRSPSFFDLTRNRNRTPSQSFLPQRPITFEQLHADNPQIFGWKPQQRPQGPTQRGQAQYPQGPTPRLQATYPQYQRQAQYPQPPQGGRRMNMPGLAPQRPPFPSYTGMINAPGSTGGSQMPGGRRMNIQGMRPQIPNFGLMNR